MVIKIQVGMPGFISEIMGFFGSLPEKVVEVGRNIISGLWNGISSKIQWLKDKITGFAGGSLTSLRTCLR